MSTTTVAPLSLGDRLATVRQLFDLIAALEKLSDPLTSAAGLHEAIALVLQLATALGANADTLAAISRVLNQDAVFNILLAVVQYLASALANSTQSADAPSKSA